MNAVLKPNSPKQNPRVTLVGAGPGDPDLITVRGLRALQQADVIFHDRLVSPELLERARKDAVLIDVGKKPKQHRVSQLQIQQLIVRHARSGNHVVRLKGGDAFVFGRGFEELEMCRRHNIPCEVIPGITSAIAGPAVAGIPVTARGMARSFAVLTAESGASFDDPGHNWQALTQIDTLVILMGRRTLSATATALTGAGKSAETPVACIERATLASQRVVKGTLGTIDRIADAKNLQAPMVIVVGEVVGLVGSQELINRSARLVGDAAHNILQKQTG